MELAQWETLTGSIDVTVPVSHVRIIATISQGCIRRRHRNHFLHVVVARRIKFAHVGLIKEIQRSYLASRDGQIRMRCGTDGAGQYDDSRGSHVDVVGLKYTLIERSKPVENGTCGAQLHRRVSPIARPVISAVSG